MLPYDTIGYDPSRHPAHLPIDLDTPAGRILDAALHALIDAAPTLSLAAARDRADGRAALVRGLLRLGPLDDPARRAVDAARGQAMRAWQDARLVHPGPDRPDRDADALARAFGVSRRTVYRQFEAVGGVDQYARQRRLEGAMRALLAAEPTRGGVRQAAELWGFDDPSHFHRRFRAAFSVARRDAMRFDTPPMPPPAAAPLRTWLAARQGRTGPQPDRPRRQAAATVFRAHLAERLKFAADFSVDRRILRPMARMSNDLGALPH